MNSDAYLSIADRFATNSGWRFSLACLAAAVAAASPLVGCSGGSGSAGTGQSGSAPAPDYLAGTAAAPNVVNGTLLYSVSLGADHTIDFFKMANGVAAARETMPIGDNNPIIDRLSGKHVRLADIFRLAQPQATEVPQAILQADPPAPAGQPAAGPLSPIVKTAANDVNPNGREGVLPGEALTAAATCTPDELNDNWGADWFIKNYCTGGNTGWCWTNRTFGYIEVDNTDWFKWSVMAADFAAGATIQVDFNDDYTSGQWWNGIYQSIAARHIQTWSVSYPSVLCIGSLSNGVCDFNPTGSFRATATGDSACKRLHYAANWNN